MPQISDNQSPSLSNDAQFLDELLTLAGFTPDEDDFEVLKADLQPLLSERALLKIYDALPTEEDRETFDTLMDATDEKAEGGDKVLSFLYAKIPDFDNFMADIYLEFQEEYLAAMKGE